MNAAQKLSPLPSNRTISKFVCQARLPTSAPALTPSPSLSSFTFCCECDECRGTAS